MLLKSVEMKIDKFLVFNLEGYFGCYCFIFDMGIVFVIFYYIVWLIVLYKYEIVDCIF